MAFWCPQCETSGTLTITHTLELPPDRQLEEITLQVVNCRRCGFSGLAVYEEARRGRLDGDNWQHIGYQIRNAEVGQLIDDILACPEPHNPRCNCPTHRAYGKQDAKGLWVGLTGLTVKGQFRLVLAT